MFIHSEERNMSGQYSRWWLLAVVSLVVNLGAAMSACGFGGDSWKEEVLLHDGSKIIVERSQSYGGRHELDQSPPIKEHTITFLLPGSDKRITWTSEYGEDIGRANFNLLALHIIKGTPYIVAEPNLILSYNKWGRPNPPYVLFKHDGKEWHRITIEEFPTEFKTLNVTIDTRTYAKQLAGQGFASAAVVKELNSGLTQEEYKTIHRTPLDHWKPRPPGSNSGRMVRTKNGWIGMDWFEDQPSIEACVKLCEKKGVSPQDCPCHTLFKGK
jgi:hypothetical protein